MRTDTHAIGLIELLACTVLLASGCSKAAGPQRPAAAGMAANAATGMATNAAGGQPAMAAASSRAVVVNGIRLPAETLRQLEQGYSLSIADGNYWYDPRSGAAGPAGGPTLTFIMPGLALGGPLRAEASAGNTGVFLNGRELPQYDLIRLTQLIGFVMPGRYFLDANGNAGYEGGPPLVNLVAASRQSQSRGGGDGWYSNNTNAGGNESGGTGYVMGKDASGNTWSSSYEH